MSKTQGYYIDSFMPPHKIMVEASDLNPVVLFLVDAPSEAADRRKKPLSQEAQNLLLEIAEFAGFKFPRHTIFLTACPHIPDEIYKSDSKKSKFVKEYLETTHTMISKLNPKVIIPMGNTALQAAFGRKVSITASRGTFMETTINGKVYPVYPVFSPQQVAVNRRDAKILASDLVNLKNYIAGGYQPIADFLEVKKDYKICTDLQFLIDNPPEIMAVDTETTGLNPKYEHVFPFLVQISYRLNESLLIPVARDYWPEVERDHTKLLDQLKTLLENPQIRKVGHNFKFDYKILKKLGITVKGWSDDTLMMMRYIDENIQDKSLNNGVRLFVPSMAGYNDKHEIGMNKSQMWNVDKETMIQYAGGDTDATLHLFQALQPMIDRLPKHKFLYETIAIPALKAAADTLEDMGFPLRRDLLVDISQQSLKLKEELAQKVLDEVPKSAMMYWLGRGKKPNLNSNEFKAMVLFSEYGFGLRPKFFTDTGQPSVDTVQLEQFSSMNEFASKLLEYNKMSKLCSTYIGVPKDEKGQPKGMFKHLVNDCGIYPTYNLHQTVTHRWSSSDPNGQNLPKRGEGAKLFRSSIKAPDGYKLVEVDFSQLELRIMAWIADVEKMKSAYDKGQDLHAVTAVGNLLRRGDKIVSEAYRRSNNFDDAVAAFSALEESESEEERNYYEISRYNAKAPNFGLIYKMSRMGYLEYGRNVYKRRDMTEADANTEYDAFYQLYPELLQFFEKTEEELYSKGYVENLFGLRRNLPNIHSTAKWARGEAEREAVNFKDQSLGGLIATLALIRIQLARLDNPKFAQHCVPIGFIHDSLIFLTKEEHLDYCMTLVNKIMPHPPIKELFGIECPVDLPVDFKYGDTLNVKEKWKPKAEFEEAYGDSYVLPGHDTKRLLVEDLPVFKLLREALV